MECTDINECLTPNVTDCHGDHLIRELACFKGENGEITLDCPAGMGIEIYKTFYGRDESDTCCTFNDELNFLCGFCGNTFVEPDAFFNAECSGLETCTVQLNKEPILRLIRNTVDPYNSGNPNRGQNFYTCNDYDLVKMIIPFEVFLGTKLVY